MTLQIGGFPENDKISNKTLTSVDLRNVSYRVLSHLSILNVSQVVRKLRRSRNAVQVHFRFASVAWIITLLTNPTNQGSVDARATAPFSVAKDCSASVFGRIYFSFLRGINSEFSESSLISTEALC